MLTLVQKKEKQNLQVLTLPGYILYFLTTLCLRISIQILYILFICLVFDGLLQSTYFRMFPSKHSITFVKHDFSVLTYFAATLDSVKLTQ